MSRPFEVAVVTGTRAEYGLLSPVLKALAQKPEIKVQLLVTGSHLSEALGGTVKEIEADGWPVAARLPILNFSNDRPGVAHTTAFALEQFTCRFEQNRPDAVLLLGDRYEIFAAAAAAAILEVPVVHISGGDVTLGAQDEFFRHSISKMAKLHFPSCEQSAQRLMRMGEEPFRVHNVGGLGDQNIRTMPRMRLEELEQSLGVSLHGGFLLVTFHPETQGPADPKLQMEELLSALDEFPACTLLFTKANADAGGSEINRRIDLYCEGRKNAFAFPSLGLKRYLSAMALCRAVVGNSSSGVVETPSFQKPAVNIGERQAGRAVCENVLCCPPLRGAIAQALQTALSEEFVQVAKRARSPYNGGDTAGRIADVLLEFLQSGALLRPKQFFDGGACL